MILHPAKYQITSILAKHKMEIITSLILFVISILCFYLSGALIPIAWGTLISSLLLLIPSGWLIIFQRSSSTIDDIADRPTQEIRRITTSTIGGDHALAQQSTYNTVAPLTIHDPEATIIAKKKTSSKVVVGPHLQESSQSDPGIVRKNRPNEDNILALTNSHQKTQSTPLIGLFVVADGMGGHANGQEASQTAIQTISVAIEPLITGTETVSSYEDCLKQAILGANLTICQRNTEQPFMMGSTITSALVVDNTAYIANVGDSRTYLYRPSVGLRQITKDHSVVASLVLAGIITPDEIYTHPKRNQIYRSLGEKPDLEVDTFTVDLQENDILLFCSDGLWEMVHDPQIERILQHISAQANLESTTLIQAALNNGGADNVSVVLARLVGKAK